MPRLGVLRGDGAPVEIGGQPCGGQCPVAGDQVVQDGGVQGGLLCLAGGCGGVAGLDQQAGQLCCPFLLGGLEVVQSFQVPEQVSLMPTSA